MEKKRYRDTPISESAIVGCAIGAAVTGMHPCVKNVLLFYSSMYGYRIVNVAAKLRYMTGGQTNVPLVIREQTGGGVSFGAQHSQNLEVMVDERGPAWDIALGPVQRQGYERASENGTPSQGHSAFF